MVFPTWSRVFLLLFLDPLTLTARSFSRHQIVGVVCHGVDYMQRSGSFS